MKTELLALFNTHGELNPYQAFHILQKDYKKRFDSFFQTFHKLRNAGLLIPIKSAIFIPTTAVERAEWDFVEIRTNLYILNGGPTNEWYGNHEKREE